MKKYFAIPAIAVGLLAGSSATAEADDMGFIQQLNNQGFSVYDANMALNWGYAICETLNTSNGIAVTEAFYRLTDYSIPDRYTAAIFVESAVMNICPWHDHRGEQAPSEISPVAEY